MAKKKKKVKKNPMASMASVITTLAPYVAKDDAKLPRKEFLRLVADRIKDDIGESNGGEDDAAFISAAKDNYTGCGGEYSDGDINVDDDAVVSQSDKGAYVAAWVWVTNEEAGIEGEDDGEDDKSETTQS